MPNFARSSRRSNTDLTRPSRSGDYHTEHDPDDTARLSTTVVHALADVMGKDTTDVQFALSDSVDPDALDHLFGMSRDGTASPAGHVAFTVGGHRVTVYCDGRIVITPPGTPP